MFSHRSSEVMRSACVSISGTLLVIISLTLACSLGNEVMCVHFCQLCFLFQVHFWLLCSLGNEVMHSACVYIFVNCVFYCLIDTDSQPWEWGNAFSLCVHFCQLCILFQVHFWLLCSLGNEVMRSACVCIFVNCVFCVLSTLIHRLGNEVMRSACVCILVNCVFYFRYTSSDCLIDTDSQPWEWGNAFSLCVNYVFHFRYTSSDCLIDTDSQPWE